MPLHLRPAAIGLVMAGGVAGAASREAIEQAVRSPRLGFPVATFVINLGGALALGFLLEVLVRAGDDSGWRRRARLLAGTGFCGAFTTYSTFAVESVQLGRHGAWPAAVAYVAASVVGGAVTAALGVALGAARARGSVAELPLDPDADRTAPGR